MANGLTSLLRRLTGSADTPQSSEPVKEIKPPRKVYKYTVIECILDEYEPVREVKHAKPEVQYLLITDSKKLKSKTWDVHHISEYPCLEGINDAIGILNYVRYHPFDFADTSVAIYIDASMMINKPLDKLYEDFVNSNSDIGLSIHPYRTNVYDELHAWQRARGLSADDVNAQIKLFSKTSFNKSVLFQSGVIIRRNVKIVNIIDEITWSFLKLTAVDDSSTRLDQTVLTYVLATYFSGVKFFLFTQHLIQSRYITWCKHGSDQPILIDKRYYIRPSVFGVYVNPYMIEPVSEPAKNKII